MGEIVFSILIGACLVISGIAMNVILTREERRWREEEEKAGKNGQDSQG